MPEDRPPKRIRKELGRLAGLAYRRELDRELGSLVADFDRWRQEETDPWELSDRIHVFHQDPFRHLFACYRDAGERLGVARALAAGPLDRDEVADDVFSHVASGVVLYSADGSMVTGPKAAPKDEA